MAIKTEHLVIGIAALAVVGGGVYLAMKNRAAAPTPATQQQRAAATAQASTSPAPMIPGPTPRGSSAASDAALLIASLTGAYSAYQNS